MSFHEYNLLIRPFEVQDQDAARRLILNGLGEHFSFINESLNPDLHDIMTTYVTAGHTFIVAQYNQHIVGTGALISERPEVGRIVRMSVDREYRRRGIGQAIIEYLANVAKQRGYRQILLETNNGWDDAIGLYKRVGFVVYRQSDVGVYMKLDVG